MKLAEEHSIEQRLYCGDGIERIYNLLGDSRLTRWFADISEKNLSDENTWKYLLKFLEKDLKVQQQKVLHGCSSSKVLPVKMRDEKKRDGGMSFNATSENSTVQTKCFICGGSDHISTNGPNNSKLIQYFSCKAFVDMTPSQRFHELKSKGLCYQCLFPGASLQTGKHKEGKCQHDFSCKHEMHQKFAIKKHILVCQDHANTNENKAVLEEYKRRCMRQRDVPSYSKEIRISLHAEVMSASSDEQSSYLMKSNTTGKREKDIITDRGIYLLQTIIIDNNRYNIFYDTGCSDLVCRFKAVKHLGDKAKQEYDGPINIGGVGDVSTKSMHGIYQVRLPLYNGRDAVLSGVCLDQITATFPMYPLQGQVDDDIKAAFANTGGNPDYLPKLPPKVGGDTDFMLGAKYLRYHPKPVLQLPSGLTIYESMFLNADGGRGVIGGPHEIFNRIHSFHHVDMQMFLSNQYQLFKTTMQINPDVEWLHVRFNKDYSKNLMYHTDDDVQAMTNRNHRIFEEVEQAGCDVSYRCLSCRNCKDCRDHDSIEATSIREEIEQDLIDKSVTVNLEERSTLAKLPLLHNPDLKLAPNKDRALRVYYQQARKLEKNPNDKQDVIESEKKMQTLGFVDFVKNLPNDQQQMLEHGITQNFIPWRAVWNGNSISTPCRIVFDASQATSTGLSLNDIVAKGKNNMNKLVEILVRWMTHRVAFHTDVRKMYNSVKLQPQHWCLQRYVWHAELDASKIPEEKVIKTLIYGVRLSGNQAERGLRETARLSKEAYPEIYRVVNKDVYVDDCLSGDDSMEKAHMRSDELEIVVNRGGYTLKGVTFSRHKPDANLSEDGQSVNVAGMKWFPEGDFIALDVSELNFAKKCRGKKPSTDLAKMIPQKLTRRHCVSKVAEIFDITGKVTPLTAGMKLDLHHLVQLKLDWDDVLPDNLRGVWLSHFEMMQEIPKIKFNRAIIPDDASSLAITTINTGDASKSMICIAIYVRFKRLNGDYSCQLVFSRSKLVPDGLSQPRAELMAATLNSHTGEVVRRSLYQQHEKGTYLTDSQIVLYWIHNENKRLKQWVRNRVIEIRRLTNPDDWMYVESRNMIADLGTRKGVTLNDVSQDSTWVNGFPWMSSAEEKFPMSTVQDIKLSREEEEVSNKEQVVSNDVFNTSVPVEVKERYRSSDYLIDPNRFRFKKVLKVLSIVIQFIQSVYKKVKNRLEMSKDLNIVKDPLIEAERYFYRKATNEVKEFTKKKKYIKSSVEKDGILYYVGRMLPQAEVEGITTLSSAMLDLTTTTFCVPMVDKHSPIAYSVVNEIHWYHKVARHKGVETVHRYVQQKIFIIDGRELSKFFRKKCEHCRYLAKKAIEVSMGPVSDLNLKIAPAFFSTQIDLCGPFMAYCNHHKRTTVKVWFIVFCCTTTSATKIKLMDDYSTSSFIQSFTRFACEVGYPKYLLSDEGSQLVKGCEEMKLNFKDVKNQLYEEVGVEFSVCPVGGHHMHGKIERQIREIKKSIEINCHNERLSVLEWETLAAEISNTINDLPLTLGNISADFEQVDILTPNRLLLGRNNNRSPTVPLIMSTNLSKFLKCNQKIFNAWFDTWLISHVPKLINQPKWFENDRDIKVGDIVLFLKRENLNSTYQYGMVDRIKQNPKDGKIRKVLVRYRNASENADRFTNRAVRQLVMIHPVDELSLSEELTMLNIE